MPCANFRVLWGHPGPVPGQPRPTAPHSDEGLPEPRPAAPGEPAGLCLRPRSVCRITEQIPERFSDDGECSSRKLCPLRQHRGCLPPVPAHWRVSAPQARTPAPPSASRAPLPGPARLRGRDASGTAQPGGAAARQFRTLRVPRAGAALPRRAVGGLCPRRPLTLPGPAPCRDGRR